MSYCQKATFFAIILNIAFIFVINAQYYSPTNMGGAVGCVVTGNQLYSHGNYIRDLNLIELNELSKYKKELIEFKEKVDAAYANIDEILKKNGTLPTIPARPIMPSFCASNETTLYILGGCTVQNYKVYIGGKFARELNEKEKEQLNEFAKQMVAANYAATQTSDNNSIQTNSNAIPATTTILPTTNSGRQIALDFCIDF